MPVTDGIRPDELPTEWHVSSLVGTTHEDGVPRSGKISAEALALQMLSTQPLNAVLAAGAFIPFTSKAAMDADLDHPVKTIAWVVGDAAMVANNGIYRKVGTSGSGSWVRFADLPYSFQVANWTEAGTVNAIKAETALPVHEYMLVILNIEGANTASPVTVSFNGDTPLTIKTASGADVPVGTLVSGLGIVSGSTFRLLSDIDVSAILDAVVAAAEAAQVAAASIVTINSLVVQLGLTNDQAGYEAALDYFLDHPTMTKLEFGPITFVGAYTHTIASGAARRKFIDTGASMPMPSTDQHAALRIINELEWVEVVEAITPSFLNITESDPPASQSAVTILTLANERTIERASILKIYSLDRLPNVHNPLDGPGVKLTRAGEPVVGMGNDGNDVVIVGRLVEEYGGPGYEGTVRLAKYARRSLEITGGGRGNPIGDADPEDLWRGWSHTEIIGFENFVADKWHVQDHYGAGLAVVDCYAPHLSFFRGQNFSNSRVSTGANRYGYALLLGPGTSGAQITAPVGINNRHLIDTGSSGITNDEEWLQYPWMFGVPHKFNVHGGSGMVLSNAPWGAHHNLRWATFYNTFADGTFVGDDSGGLSLASRGNDVHFVGGHIITTRNAASLGGIKGGSIQDFRMEFGWNGLGLPSAEGMFARNNELICRQLHNDGAAIAVGGAYVGADGLTYPRTRDNPTPIGYHSIRVIGNGSVGGSPKFTILRMVGTSHVYIEDDIYVDISEYDGDVTLVEFEYGWPLQSLRFAPGKRMIVRCRSSTGNVYRFFRPSGDTDRLVTSMTRVGTTVTVLTSNVSLLYDGMSVRISGVSQTEYLGRHDNITMIEGGFTFELEEGVEPATPATSPGAGIYFRRIVAPEVDMTLEVSHDTTAIGGAIDQNIDPSLINLREQRLIAGTVTRDTADFAFLASSPDFYVFRPVDKVTHYAVGGTGGYYGADIESGTLQETQTLVIRNSASRAIGFYEPKLFLPPKSAVTLKGGKSGAWTRVDIGAGPQLIMGGFIDLAVAGDQPLYPAMDIGPSGWRWNFTNALIVAKSGSFGPTKAVLTASADYKSPGIDLTASSSDLFSFDIVHYRISYYGKVQEVRLPVWFARGGDSGGNNVYAIWEAVIAINDQLDRAGMDITCSSTGTRLVLTSDAAIPGVSEIIQIENIVADGANTLASDLGFAEGEYASGTGCVGGIFQLAGGTGQPFVAGNTDLSDLGASHLINIPVDAGRADPFWSLRGYTDQVLYFRMLAGYEASASTLCDVYIYGNLI